MQAVVDQHDLTQSDVWLFSAGGDNPDAVAASRAALDRKAGKLHLVTCNPYGQAAAIVERGGGTVDVVPVADPKAGHFPTHSLISYLIALLLHCDAASHNPPRSAPLLDNHHF